MSLQTTLSAYINKSEISQINNLMMYLKILEKREQWNLNVSTWKETINIREKLM
jgi:hypothetical protein